MKDQESVVSADLIQRLYNVLLLNITFLRCEVFTVSAFEFSCPCVS